MKDWPKVEASTLSEAITIELIALRRDRKRIDDRMRELIGMERKENAQRTSSDPADRPNDAPCHCLRCDYAWYPDNADVLPKCCSRCGTTNWMLPPTATSRRPGDEPAPSWRRRKDPRDALTEHAKRIRRARETTPVWRSPAAPAPTMDEIIPPSPLPEGKFHSMIFPPPPDVRAMLAPPPTPANVSLSARLAEYRREDASPEQPERTVSAPPPPEIIIDQAQGDLETTTVGELAPLTAEEEAHLQEGTENFNKLVETMREVPPEEIGVPSTDAERSALAIAQEEAWPTTKSDD